MKGKQSKAIESNMEPYVKEAVKQFRKKYTDYRQWKNLQSGIRWREDVRLSQQAQREMKHFLKKNKLEACKESFEERIGKVLKHIVGG